METAEEKLARLLNTNDWTEAERRWLLSYLEDTDHAALKEIMFNDFDEKLQRDQDAILETPAAHVLENIHRQIRPEVARRFYIARWAVAASVMVLVTIGAWFFANYQGQESSLAGKQPRQPAKQVVQDVMPGSNKAVLTLSDGSTVLLDDAQNGKLARQGNTRVLKFNGRLTYQPDKINGRELLFNTVATPRGGQYQVTLPDGSEVWLNAESSIRFPIAFSGAERKVEVTGEAYFEVAKNRAMPFIVKVGQSEVRVLGTHFNIMAYNGEAYLKTTLLEGAVQFINNNRVDLLAPGQQSQLDAGGRVRIESNVNVEEEIAWKNGSFHFERAGIHSVMRQIERWYDVQVVYKKELPGELFHADIPRNTNLSLALQALELTGKVHFEIEGKKIIVMP